MISTQQVAGENAALDLMLAHLTHDAEAIASATVDSNACPTTQAYARQQLCGLLHDAVLARPNFSLNRPAVLGPAGRSWLQHVTMHRPVADTVIALADDGGVPRTTSMTTSGSPPTPSAPSPASSTSTDRPSPPNASLSSGTPTTEFVVVVSSV
ncbi:hypothetical protein [Streptomyces sp. NRRL F-2580]|uniref:hypothetical protein n=1 Tax=Streptomyces sp. NRRL F-2580 TaxID=1463841 RepID=UPI000AABAA37|nr:hypothetical protein [Streptomyces sp. NRRL F-2580]